MSLLRCYVAAPFGDAPFVREVHACLRLLGLGPTSSWAEHADGSPEQLDAMPLEEVRALAERNDHALATSDVVLVLPREGAGREMYAEARLAIAIGLPVVWVGGPRPLSAYREGVILVDSLTDAFRTLYERSVARDVAAA
ncbi:MAG: hypothetical protein HYV09_39740 [Deltaproteobacteria bacterium]|nr:hypothetical protein [Deltaproteobacteria bacterium]